MKNLLLIAFLGATLSVVSCSATSQAKQAQTQRAEFLKLKGDWEITSIDYDSKNYRIKPFDEGADAKCFIGSHWRLIPNNYSGSYTLNGGGSCPSVIQPIKIDMINDHQFMFKKMQEGVKAKNVVSGYNLQLTNQATDQFSLEQTIPSNGETIKVVYNFQRTAMK